MPHSMTIRPPRRRIRVAGSLILAIALASALSVVGAAAQQQASKRVAKKAENATLGKTILTTLGGRTLYSLSAETNGRFICTGSCLKDWLPLTVPVGTRPTGPVKLRTIVRPDNGRTQVTYKGRPLYRFDDDKKAGDVEGEGFKDVGTWHAATPPQRPAEPAPQPQPPENPYPY
jgi:predicted lipoprotein with Yx(FWY)xxD motif